MRIYWPLYPLALLYGGIVALRNKCFDWGILREECFPLPVICIGNLTVGGTGKTPHTEYLIRLLKQQGKVAVLSRGYKRNTKGFLLADEHTPMSHIGDEPYQMKQKFPDVAVAVDTDRCEGIKQLQALHPDVILLDDAYQHRYVKASLNLLLTDYNRLMTRDTMLPAGRLREPLSGKKRACIMLVTKCPKAISADECTRIRRELQPEAHQKVYFSTLLYKALHQVFAPTVKEDLSAIQPDDEVLLLTGIANPAPMREEIAQRTTHITQLDYPDHHSFTHKDMAHMQAAYRALPNPGKRWIITTEKDATRLTALEGWNNEMKQNLWALPIEVKILEGKEQEFNDRICKELKLPPWASSG